MQIFQILIRFTLKYQKTSLLLISPSFSSEKSFRYWEAVLLMVADTSFPKFLFLLESSNLSLATNTIACFTWSDSSLHSILKKYLWNTQAWITILCLSVFLSLKMVLHEKAASTAHSYTRALHNTHTLVCSRSTLCVFPISPPKIFKIYVFESWALIKSKINHFYCCMKDTLKWSKCSL